ncbi:MAG: 6-phosphofructokinase [Lachnospiraceae bacterium]|nr:6-phosphofructokinase [Lachnospiraceae bacterium]
MNRIKTIGLLTSGGDAPGMNAALRGVVRCAVNNGLKVIGFEKGYNGLIDNEYREMDKRSVSDIVDRGGTILFTARSKEFLTREGREKAIENLDKNNIDALVVLGGDGTFRGAKELYEQTNGKINVVAIPATIDLDIASTEYTIGFDTAINTAMEGVDRIRDTSTSHERCSIVEVMGRNAGYIAAYTGISTGAEEILIPEINEYADINKIITRVRIANKKGKKHYIIINAEGIGHSNDMAKMIETATGIETRATILGHLQRGGSPTCKDRVYASIMGCRAVEVLLEGKENRLVVYQNGEFTDVDLTEGIEMKKSFPQYFIRTAEELESK